MVQMSNKWFIAIIAICIVVASLIVAGILLGWFEPLAGVGGPVIAGLYELFATPLRWILSGGWPTMLAGVFGAVAVIFIFGYVFEQKQVIATLRGTNTGASAGTYQNAPDQNIIPLTNQQSTPSKEE